MIEKTKHNHNFFQTSDIWLVAYLMATGEKYISIDRRVNENKPQVFFLFPPETEELAHNFFNGDKIPAIDLKDAVGRVKSILWDL